MAEKVSEANKATPILLSVGKGDPIVTFPLGAGAEAMCAYLALTPLRAGGYASLLCGVVKMIVPVNLLGGLGAYGGLVKKGLASLKPAAKEKA